MNIEKVGNGKVILLAGGGKVYTDIAAKFVRSERSLEEIAASPYDKKLVYNIINNGHLAATEFDYFVFGVEGYSRVTETQLVRKRIASYIIKSGRVEKNGKRSFDMVLPESLSPDREDLLWTLFPVYHNEFGEINIEISPSFVFQMIEKLYNVGLERKIPEEELRYMKPQATEFKGIIGMNAHALIDWFAIRCCKNAQAEIRDMANKMLALCKEAAPDLFANAGPRCKVLGYCPENDYQNEKCKGKVFTRKVALDIMQRRMSGV